MIKNIKKAFTLAEVLMVVMIIGVVATLTVPNLSNNINEDKTVTLLRSTINQLDAAYAKVLSEYGSWGNAIRQDCASGASSTACGMDKVVSHLELRQNCRTSTTACFVETMDDIDGSESDFEGCTYAFILANGVSVCNLTNIDIDGPNKGPNRRGYDCFRITSYDDGDGIKPRMGGEGRIKSDGSIDGFQYDEYTEWAFSIGNMDYLRCAEDLNWITKHSCD